MAFGDGRVTILDTNVVSETMASSPVKATLAWIAKTRTSDDLFITPITIAEILYGVELLPPVGAGQREGRGGVDVQARLCRPLP